MKRYVTLNCERYIPDNCPATFESEILASTGMTEHRSFTCRRHTATGVAETPLRNPINVQTSEPLPFDVASQRKVTGVIDSRCTLWHLQSFVAKLVGAARENGITDPQLHIISQGSKRIAFFVEQKQEH